ERPGASVPSSWVFGSACSKTSRVLRSRNFSSPTFSSTSAFFPSQTTTQSPWRTFSLDMGKSPRLDACSAWPSRALRWIKRRGSDSVAAVEQPPGNDLCLNLRGALEDRQDAGVAQQPRGREFEREAVAAVDLHR